MPSTADDRILRYAGYDKKTGQIIHTHSRFSVAENRFVEIPIDELVARFSTDPDIVARLTDRDSKNLDFIKVSTSEHDQSQGPMMVDPTHRKLVPRPSLRLTTKKTQLAGDGKDSTEIEISAVDGHGKHQNDVSGEVRITTTRGKLSARGGVVKLTKGRATITLTSVNETVSNVRLTAAPVDGAHTAARLDLEFI